MKLSLIIAATGGGLAIATSTFFGFSLIGLSTTSSSAEAQKTQSAIGPLISGDYLIAAPGRVEAASENIQVGAGITGILNQVLVHQGDNVTRGEVLAKIDDSEYVANLGKAEADLQLANAELTRVINGALPAEREAALALVREADAVEKNASGELDRERQLRTHGINSQQAFDRAQRDYSVATQEHAAQAQRYALLNDPTRQEDVDVAKAKVAAARAVRDQAQAMLDKTVIKSPIDGTVLRLDHHIGELITVYAPQPIMTIGDLSKLNVRAEVDEADISKLDQNASAYVTADAYGAERFPAHIARVGQLLGSKNIQVDPLKERTDGKVLEVLLSLDAAGPLIPGLPVNVFMTRPQVSNLN